MLDHAKKLEFVHKMAKLGLQHFDGGGIISAGNSNPLSGVAGALTAQNGFQATSPYVQQQEGVANQFAQEAAGQGPNPALAQLNQTTQQNAQQAAAAAASNRGLNAGQAQRLSNQALVNANQQAGGQAAALQAQQQIAAQNQEEGVYNNLATQNLGAQGINAQVSQNNANSVNQTQGGILGAVGSVFGLAKGGVVNVHEFASGGAATSGSGGSSKMFDNGYVPGSISTPYAPSFSNAAATAGTKFGPKSGAGKALNDNPSDPGTSPTGAGGSFGLGGQGMVDSLGAGGASVAELAPAAALMKKGGSVKAADPSEKATVKGDSLKNDKVPALLSQGEIVIPRHITMGKDPVNKAAAFVRAHLAKKGLGAV